MTHDLSKRAHAWLATLDATTLRAPDLSRTMPELPAWEALSAVEMRWGHVHGQSSDTQELNIGVQPETRTLFGRQHVLVGNYGPVGWFMDEAGRLVELDDLGHTFYRADSLQQRIEQLAMLDVLPAEEMEKVAGAHGAAMAERAGLSPIHEPTDRWQRYFGGDGIIVVESTEPVDYGATELWTVTYVYASSAELLRRALGTA